jgi:hypothetical protein
MDPELFEHVHSPTLPDCHAGIDYLRAIVKQIGHDYVSHCKHACVEFMETAWKSGKCSNSGLVGFRDVLKVIENIGGDYKNKEEDPRWEAIYNIWTGQFQAGKINSPGSWLMPYMKKHFHYVPCVLETSKLKRSEGERKKKSVASTEKLIWSHARMPRQ